MSHISICICTFKRPDLLHRLLVELEHQETEGLFSCSVVVADNDRLQSAKQVVTAFAAASTLPVTYCVEPQQNIALARNKAVEHARGDFVVFIDDDEIPDKRWLCNLFKTCNAYRVDGVLGPVKPRFEHVPPEWVLKGKFFERPEHADGYRLSWPETRTGNVLFKKEMVMGIPQPFRPAFGTGGEDVDFFRRMMEKGKTFVWCNDAVVSELVPPSRCTCGYLLRRALVRGSTFPKRSTNHLVSLTKSLIAVPIYALALPVLALFGMHLLVRYLIKLCDHLSRLFAYLGWQLQRERAG